MLRDAIKAHRSLLCKGAIMHQDILENDIIITKQEEADGLVRMLMDFDFASVRAPKRALDWSP